LFFVHTTCDSYQAGAHFAYQGWEKLLGRELEPPFVPKSETYAEELERDGRATCHWSFWVTVRPSVESIKSLDTLLGTDIFPFKGTVEDDFPNFARWGMLVPWRVDFS